MNHECPDNQWPVNFNWVLSSFEPHIRGVRNLVDFSLSSLHKPFLLFVSSVSAVGGWKGRTPVPEKPIYDLSVAGEMGYGQSKLISELLLDQAAKIAGVRSACCRVGVVAGPVERMAGAWNRHEYIPSVSIVSQLLLFFPRSDQLNLPSANIKKKDHHIFLGSAHLPLHLPIPRPH